MQEIFLKNISYPFLDDSEQLLLKKYLDLRPFFIGIFQKKSFSKKNPKIFFFSYLSNSKNFFLAKFFDLGPSFLIPPFFRHPVDIFYNSGSPPAPTWRAWRGTRTCRGR